MCPSGRSVHLGSAPSWALGYSALCTGKKGKPKPTAGCPTTVLMGILEYKKMCIYGVYKRSSNPLGFPAFSLASGPCELTEINPHPVSPLHTSEKNPVPKVARTPTKSITLISIALRKGVITDSFHRANVQQWLYFLLFQEGTVCNPFGDSFGSTV